MRSHEARPPRRWAVRVAVPLAAVAAAAWFGAFDLARDALGALGIPDRCALALDRGLEPTDFRIDYFRRDEPRDVRETVFDGVRCRFVPSRNGETTFYVDYRGEHTCVVAYLKGSDAALLTYAFKCSNRTGRVVCSADLGGSPIPTSCHGWPHSEQPAF